MYIYTYRGHCDTQLVPDVLFRDGVLAGLWMYIYMYIWIYVYIYIYI